jgi:hypothetical protein
MPAIQTITGDPRRIFLHIDTVNAGLTSFDMFYRDYRVMRENDDTLQVFSPFLVARGNIPKGGGKFTPRYVQLLNGALIVPYNTSHELLVTFEIITDDGRSGINCFDRSPLSSTSRIDINYNPPQVEIIKISTGGTALTDEEHNRLMSIPTQTLLTDERAQLMGISNDGLLTEQRAKELMYERENTIENGVITETVAGGDTVVRTTFQNRIPLRQVITP